MTILPTASRFLLGLYASVPQVVGGHLLNKLRKPIYALTRSKSLWEHRIAILSTLHFIRFGDFGDALAISLKLLKDQEDLIHKASGWMLREDGKKDQDWLVAFLDQHVSDMPRTMLRYAINRFTPELRQSYLSMRNRSGE